MTVEELLDKMFPGNKAMNLCAFSGLGLAQDVWLEADCLKAVTALLGDLDKSLLKGDEVNELLKVMRGMEPETMRQFIVAALEAYFSAPAVVISLTGGPATLFPNQRVLPEIDYDLLEPVLERGDI